MKLVKGSDLNAAQRQEVLNAFGYRFMNTTIYPKDEPVMARSQHDGQWLEQHAFYIRKDGHLAHKPNHCEPVFLADIR